MQISITFRHMEASEAVRHHIVGKMEHLQKYLIKPIDLHVTLSVEKFRHTAEIILLEQYFQAKAKEVTNDMYLSIDRAIDKIGAQIKKHKNKVQEHHKHHIATGAVTGEAEEEFLRRAGNEG